MAQKAHVYFSSVYIGNSDNNAQNFNERAWMALFMGDMAYVLNRTVQYLDGDFISHELCNVPNAPKSNFNDTVNYVNTGSAAKREQGIRVLALDFHVNNSNYAPGLQVRYHRNSKNNAHAFFNKLRDLYGKAKLPINNCIEGNTVGYTAKTIPEAFILMLGSTGNYIDINNIVNDVYPIKRHYMAYAIAMAIFAHFGVKWKPVSGFEKHYEFRQFDPEPIKQEVPKKTEEPKVEEIKPPPKKYSKEQCLSSIRKASMYSTILETKIGIWRNFMFFENLMDQYLTRAWRYRMIFENIISIFENLLLL